MRNSAWDEQKHPRGQPNNSGQFTRIKHTRPETPKIDVNQLSDITPNKHKATLKDNKVWFTYPYNSALNGVIKAAGGRFDGEKKQWWMWANNHYLARVILEEGFQPCQALVNSDIFENAKYAGTACLEGDKVWLSYPYDTTINDQVKEYGGRFDKTRKQWWIEADSYLLDEFYEIANFKKPSATDTETQKETPRKELALQGFQTNPFPFQIEGIQHAIDNRRVIIADQPGLGKTVQALGAAWSEDAFPAIIVCPANLLTNWEREAKRAYADAKSILKLDRQPSTTISADVTILSYNRLATALPYLPPNPETVIFDEAHYMKTWKSERTKAGLELAKTANPEGMTILLSGTPIPNRVAELAPQLAVLDKLKRFGGWQRFADRYCAPRQVYAKGGRIVTLHDGADNLDELADRLAENTIIRRTKNQVLHDLPSKLYSVVTVDPTPALADTYQAIEDAAIALQETEWEDNKQPEEPITAPTEAVREVIARIAAHPNLADIPETLLTEASAAILSSTNSLALLSGLRQFTAVMKLDHAVKQVKSMLSNGDGKIVIFAHHRPVLQRLAAELETGVIHGDVSAAERQRLIDDFQSDTGNNRVLILGATTSAEGINLQAGSDVIMVEQPWNPGLCEQAEDRCHRIGQNQQVTIHYLLAANTVDEKVARIIDRKRQIIRTVLDGLPNADPMLSDETNNEDITKLVWQWLTKGKYDFDPNLPTNRQDRIDSDL